MKARPIQVSSDLKKSEKIFYFFCITQESDPVQMYWIVVNGLMFEKSTF